MCSGEATLPGRAGAITHHPRCKYRHGASANANVSSQTDRTSGLGGAHCPKSENESQQAGAADRVAESSPVLHLEPGWLVSASGGFWCVRTVLELTASLSSRMLGLKQPNPQEPFPNNPQTPSQNRTRLYNTAGFGTLHSCFRVLSPSCSGPWVPQVTVTRDLIRGCSFSAFCQHCWVRPWLHTHRSVAC